MHRCLRNYCALPPDSIKLPSSSAACSLSGLEKSCFSCNSAFSFIMEHRHMLPRSTMSITVSLSSWKCPLTRSCGRPAQENGCRWQAPARRTRKFSRAVRTDDPAAAAGDELQAACLYGVPVEKYRLTPVKNNMFFLFKCLIQRNLAQNQSLSCREPGRLLKQNCQLFCTALRVSPLSRP